MTNLILHIPHSSDKIPFDTGYVVDRKVLDQEIIKLTDWYTDDLFLFEDSIIVKADFSRIFCDTERFSDDSQEVMAKYGMGVLYEKSDDGSVIREINVPCDALIPGFLAAISWCWWRSARQSGRQQHARKWHRYPLLPDQVPA